MTLIQNISSLLVGFSFSLLLFNPIAFGVCLGIGVLLLLFGINEKIYKEPIINNQNSLILLLFFISLCISSFFSIFSTRSFPVIIYLISFIILNFYVFKVLKNNKNLRDKIFKFFFISAHLNILVVLLYVFYNYPCNKCSQYETLNLFEFLKALDAVEKYKGFLNVFAINALITGFFYKRKLNFFTIFTLLPCLIISNCNSAILGILLGLLSLLIFFLFNMFFKKKYFLIFSSIISIFIFSLIAKNLPQKFSIEYVQNFEPRIPGQIIDIHRQFMWGFSINKFIEKPIFGYGPDTSNFIPEGQKEIGSKYTGKMFLISSHPHNFLIELLLEVGIVGFTLFVLFITFLNIEIAKKCSRRQLYFLLFFNVYFWGASLVNFSFWQGWWQVSYYFLLALMSSKIFETNKKVPKRI